MDIIFAYIYIYFFFFFFFFFSIYIYIYLYIICNSLLLNDGDLVNLDQTISII